MRHSLSCAIVCFTHVSNSVEIVSLLPRKYREQLSILWSDVASRCFLFGHVGRNYRPDGGYTPPGKKSSLIVEETRLCQEPTNTSVLFRLRSEIAQPAGCFFYRETKDHLFVSNHLEMLLGLANGHKELDKLCAANYLHTGAMAPGRTLAKGVFRVASNEELFVDTSLRKIEKRSLATEPCIREITDGTVPNS